LSAELVMVKLRKTLVDDLRVRVAAVLIVAAIISWQFLPVWARFAVVMYASWPIVASVVLAGAVGWLTLNWRHCLNTGILALVLLMIASVIAIDGTERPCTGYARYGMDQVDAWAHRRRSSWPTCTEKKPPTMQTSSQVPPVLNLRRLAALLAAVGAEA
jgi:hypothetical protein